MFLDIDLLDGDVGFEFGECVWGLAAESDHTIRRFLEEFLIKYAVHLFDECYRGVLLVAAEVVLDDRQLLYLRFHAGLCICANAEYCPAIRHGDVIVRLEKV